MGLLRTMARTEMQNQLKARLRGQYSYSPGSLAIAWENCIDNCAVSLVWDLFERLNLVRLDAHPDDCPFDDLHGDMFDPIHADDIPGGMRELRAQLKRAHDRLEVDGQWYYEAAIRDLEGLDGWHMADNIGGFVGDDFENSGCKEDMQIACFNMIAKHFHLPGWHDCTDDDRQRAVVFLSMLQLSGLDMGTVNLEDYSWT